MRQRVGSDGTGGPTERLAVGRVVGQPLELSAIDALALDIARAQGVAVVVRTLLCSCGAGIPAWQVARAAKGSGL